MKTKNVLELLAKMIIDLGCAWSLVKAVVDAGVRRLNLVVNPVRTIINGVCDALQDLFRMDHTQISSAFLEGGAYDGLGSDILHVSTSIPFAFS